MADRPLKHAEFRQGVGCGYVLEATPTPSGQGMRIGITRLRDNKARELSVVLNPSDLRALVAYLQKHTEPPRSKPTAAADIPGFDELLDLFKFNRREHG